MKIEMKKILIIAGVIFSLFVGAFGQAPDKGSIQVIKLINKSENFVVSLLVNNGHGGEIAELNGSKVGEEDWVQLEEPLETISLDFAYVSGQRAGLTTQRINAKIVGSDEQKRTAAKNIEQAILKELKIRRLGLSATVKVEGNTLVIIIQEAADASSRTSLGGKLEQLIKMK